jgi:branched-chain amino acid transport system substrate-binding protein
MKQRKATIYMVFLTLASCLIFTSAWAEDPIKVGIIGPFSGSLAHNAEEMKKGMLVALDEINGSGGINGRQLELVYGNTSCNPAEGLSAAKKLITRNDVLAMGGGYCSSVNIATSAVAQQEGTPNVVAIAISPTITEQGNSYVFRSCPNSPQVLDGMNSWITEVKKPKTVAFLMENSDYGRDAEKIWMTVSKQIGAKDLANMYFQIGTTDFTTEISKLKELAPEVVFHIASTTEAALVQKQSKELNFVTQWVSASGQFTAAFFEMTKSMSEYAMGAVGDPNLQVNSPVAASFVKSYKEKFMGSRSGVFGAQGYDNLKVIADAIQRAGKLSGNLEEDRQKVRDALVDTDLELVQGRIRFDEKGQLTNTFVPVVQVRTDESCKTELYIVYPEKLATKAYESPVAWNNRKCN